MYETGIYRRVGHLAQKHTFSRVFGYFSREDDFSPSSAQFFSVFSQKSLHAYTKSLENRMVIGILAFASLHDAYTMPTSAYMILGLYGVVTRII